MSRFPDLARNARRSGNTVAPARNPGANAPGRGNDSVSGGSLRRDVTPPTFRIGADENGLGARLGPLVVTAVLARVTEQGQRVLSRRPPKRLQADLGDSKLLVSHGDVALGEAWSRALSP